MNTKAIDRFAYSRNGGGTADERCLLRINIPGAETEGQQTRYKVDVTNVQTRQTWQTAHRYSEFLALRNDLLAHFDAAERKCPGCVNFEKVIKLFEFPTKRYFSSKNPVVINYRKSALRSFLALLASHTFTSSPKCPTCSGMPFTAVRDFLTEEVKGASSPTNAGGGAGGVEAGAIRESIQVKNYTTYVAPAKTNAVNSEGVFIRPGGKNSAGSRSKRDKPSAPKKEKRPNKAPEPTPQEMPSPASSSGASTTSLPPSPARVPVKTKREVPPAPVQSQTSMKESEDDEFGSLNLDFLQNAKIATD